MGICVLKMCAYICTYIRTYICVVKMCVYGYLCIEDVRICPYVHICVVKMCVRIRMFQVCVHIRSVY